MQKVNRSMELYGQDAVVANELATRFDYVHVVSKDGIDLIEKSATSSLNQLIVANISEKHNQFIGF